MRHKVVSDKDGNIINVSEVSEQVAKNGVVTGGITLMSTDTTTTSWMTMTLSSSKLSDGHTLLKNSFKWLKNPEIALTDVLAISHSGSAVNVPGTDKFTYKYTDGTGTHTLGASSTSKNDYGIAKKFNLKKIGANDAPRNHNGYMSIEVVKGNKNDIRANGYGHYTHVTIGITGSITIQTGDISISGTLKESKMPDTMVLFNY